MEKAKLLSEPYKDPRYPDYKFDYWKIKHYTDDNIEKIISDFGIMAKPRFYWLKENSSLPLHVDNGTSCSINFVLSPNAAPVLYSGTQYFYKQALINTSIPHGVKNGPYERLLLKLSIFDKTFEEMATSIKFKKDE